jgi:hypothetical protein
MYDFIPNLNKVMQVVEEVARNTVTGSHKVGQRISGKFHRERPLGHDALIFNGK